MMSFVFWMIVERIPWTKKCYQTFWGNKQNVCYFINFEILFELRQICLLVIIIAVILAFSSKGEKFTIDNFFRNLFSIGLFPKITGESLGISVRRNCLLFLFYILLRERYDIFHCFLFLMFIAWELQGQGQFDINFAISDIQGLHLKLKKEKFLTLALMRNGTNFWVYYLQRCFFAFTFMYFIEDFHLNACGTSGF